MTRTLLIALSFVAGLVPAMAQMFEPVCRTSDCGNGGPLELVCLTPACGRGDLVLADATVVRRPGRHAAAPTTAAPASSSTSGKLTQTQATKNPILVLQQFSLTDLQAALADAQAQTPPDTIAANCYQALITVLGNPIANPLPTSPGLFQLIQKGRDLKNAIANLQSNAGPLTPLATGCAPLILDGQATLIQLGVLSGAVIGSGGAFGIVPLGSAEPGSWLAYQQARDRWSVAIRDLSD